MPSSSRLLPGVLALLVLLSGCAADERVHVSAPTTTTADAGTRTVSVGAGEDAEHVVVTVAVPAGAPGCGNGLRASTAETSTAVVVTTTVDPAPSSCPATEQRELTVEVPALDGRALVVDGGRWDTVDGTVRACTGALGCTTPPTDHCDPVYLDALATDAALVNPVVSVRSCDQQWLVVDLESAPEQCNGAGNQPIVGGCSLLRRETRWFARFDDAVPGWVRVAQGRAAGCADVTRAGATFPSQLCASLPER